MHEAVHHPADAGAGLFEGDAVGAGNLRRHAFPPAFQHLSGAIEDLAPVVGGGLGPAVLRRPCGHDGVAKILARGPAVIVQMRAIRAPGFEAAPAFAADELAADVELVSFQD